MTRSSFTSAQTLVVIQDVSEAESTLGNNMVNEAVLLHFMWDYVFIRPKDSRTKESTSQAPSTASIASLRILSNSNPWQHSAHPNNPNVSCLRSGFLAGRMCYGLESTRESGTPSTQVAGMPELEEQDIDVRNVRSISGGPDLTASLQATVNDSSSDEDEEDENEVSEGLMRDVNNRIILVGAGMSKKRKSNAGKKSAVPGKNRSNMDETSRKKGGKGEKKGCSRITVLLKSSWMNQLGLEGIRNCQLTSAVVKTWHPKTKQWYTHFIALHRATEQRPKEKHVDKMMDTIFEGYQNRNEIQLSCGYCFQRDTSEALRGMVSQSFGLYNLFRGITSVAIGETEAIVPHLDHNGSNGYSIIFQLSGVKGYTRVPQLSLDITHAVDDVIFLPTSQLVHFTSSRNTDSKRIMAVGPTEERGQGSGNIVQPSLVCQVVCLKKLQ
ncbi:hypothetical protein J010_02994 [Cryptococcus neoformans]|nr:hypothetical protein C355_03203 [Cryptococcus neoformans var. grubii Th84]OXH11482.1 hypothetical protein J010_02994 [Cryptococcus neoformans var. grubii]OXH32453.1 hypothetical protein J009_03013 [Cryptococcus neoformans var. grubii]OXH52848.1 hypothetical protein J004_03061 [Cryptococcus neoformans var. grubii]OXH52925.1 hypothetical protein J003_02998 [Cryptococcus neoformans var. grubii]